MPCRAFFRSVRRFLFVGVFLVCRFCFRALCGVFGGSPLVFSVWYCVLFVAIAFYIVCNAVNFACVRFSLFFGVFVHCLFFVP